MFSGLSIVGYLLCGVIIFPIAALVRIYQLFTNRFSGNAKARLIGVLAMCALLSFVVLAAYSAPAKEFLFDAAYLTLFLFGLATELLTIFGNGVILWIDS